MKLTLTQLAHCLDLPPNTIERWVVQGRIPIQLVNRECIFNQPALEKWSASHNLKFNLPQSRPGTTVERPAESLLAAMERGGVFHNIHGNSVETLLQAAVDQLTCLPALSKADLLKKLIARENMTSTGIGNGVAIPHPRSPIVGVDLKPFIATFFLNAPVNFNSVDDKPVFVMFLLLSPSVQQHLYLLSRLSFCIRGNPFISFLKTQPTPDVLFPKIADFEIELDRTNG